MFNPGAVDTSRLGPRPANDRAWSGNGYSWQELRGIAIMKKTDEWRAETCDERVARLRRIMAEEDRKDARAAQEAAEREQQLALEEAEADQREARRLARWPWLRLRARQAAKKAAEERLREEAERRAAAEAEAERLRLEEERRKKLKDEKRKRRQEAKIAERERRAETEHLKKITLIEAWAKYESAWATLPALSADPLWSFETIPWPVLHAPASAEDISRSDVRHFLLADCHSEGLSPKDRLRAALLRWHPDKFGGKYLHKVKESDRAAVAEAVNAVCRCLHELQSQL